MILVLLAGCATNPGADDTTGDDAGVPPPPFTNGVSTLSGAADPGSADGARGTARFANPVNVAYGPDGRVYVADFDNDLLRVVDPGDGQTSTLIAQPSFSRPFAMAFAADGTLYVSTDDNDVGGHDLMSGTIWRVDIHAGTAAVIVRDIGRPRGLAVLPDGRLAMSDYAHQVIRILDPRSGLITPLAGTWDVVGMSDGTNALFATPYGLVAVADHLVVADFDNNRLRLVGLDGSVRTLAGVSTSGYADGDVTTAKFDRPQGVAAASNGDLYVTDLRNFRVRRVRGNSVDTVAGSGDGGYLDSDDRLAAQLYGLEGITLVPDGSVLFVADGTRGEEVPFNRVRTVKMN